VSSNGSHHRLLTCRQPTKLLLVAEAVEQQLYIRVRCTDALNLTEQAIWRLLLVVVVGKCVLWLQLRTLIEHLHRTVAEYCAIDVACG
jgi:hypothetical protein